MTASIILAEEADFSNVGLGLVLPISKLSLFSYFGRNEPWTTKNYVPGGANTTRSQGGGGLLVIEENSIVTQSGNPRGALQTEIPEQPEVTLMVVAAAFEPINDDYLKRPFLIGNFGTTGGVRNGLGLYFSTTGRLVGVLGNGTNTDVSVNLNLTDYLAPSFYAMTLGDGEMTVYNFTEGTKISVADTRSTPQTGTIPYRIGSSGNATSIYGRSRLWGAAISQEKLSEAEIGKVYARYKTALGTIGVNI